MDLSVIVPAYNEAINIQKSIRKIYKTLDSGKFSWEIIVVDDGSGDNTFQNAKKLESSIKNLRVVSYEKNRGKGGAIMFGLDFAKGRYVSFIDADMDIDPAYILFLYEKIRGCDIAILSKNHKDSSVTFPLYRKILSKGYYGIVRVFFNLPVSDTQVGCKMFRNDAIKKIKPFISTKKFAFDLELLAYANKMNYKIKEYPAKLNFSRGKGRIRLKNVAIMLIDTIIVFYKFVTRCTI